MRTITTKQLIEYLPKYELELVAEEYVLETLNSEPSREVGQFARKNVSGAYSSPSQGLTIQYESHTQELAWLFRWELDEEVIGFRDQPPVVELRKADKNGITRLSRYTPDFVVFRTDCLSVVEVKSEQELKKLSAKYPDQWQFYDSAWHYLPAEEAFQTRGLLHEVCCLPTGHSIETSNINLLIQAQRSQSLIKSKVKKKIQKLLSEFAWLSIADLKERVPNATSSDIYLMISNQDLFADLKNSLLTELDSCYVSTDRESLQIKRENGWKAPSSIEAIDLCVVPGKIELKNALDRIDRVNSNDNSRHTRRLRKRMKAYVDAGASPIQAMVMPYRGSSESKLPPVVRLNLNDHVRTFYMSPKRPTIYASWTHYRNWSRQQHPELQPVVLNTYRKYVAFQDSETVAFARGGKRSANAASATTEVTTRSLRAIRPFERASADHTLLKLLVRVVESNGTSYTKRPWLTVLMDDCSGCWISYFLTFNAPSKRSLSMLFRNCVREHGKLPETVHSDRGADFTSTYHKGLLAHYGVSVDYNPAAHSRFNSQVERINKQFKDQWVSQRAGNTIDYIETRKFSKNHRPQDLAELSLDQLFVEIEEYRQHYNQTVVGTEEFTPESLFNDGLKKFDFSGIDVPLNDEFLLVTAHDTHKQDYKIGPRGEIVYNGLHFYHSKLRELQPKRNRTELRIDPEDPYRVYCKVDSQWVTALNARHTKFSSQSCMTRWAEAVRVSQGRPLRDEAKQDAADMRAKSIQEFDEQYCLSRNAETAIDDVIENEELDEIFDRVKKQPLNILPENK